MSLLARILVLRGNSKPVERAASEAKQRLFRLAAYEAGVRAGRDQVLRDVKALVSDELASIRGGRALGPHLTPAAQIAFAADEHARRQTVHELIRIWRAHRPARVFVNKGGHWTATPHPDEEVVAYIEEPAAPRCGERFYAADGQYHSCYLVDAHDGRHTDVDGRTPWPWYPQADGDPLLERLLDGDR